MGNAAAQTAVGPMAIVAIDQHEDIPLVRSKVAYWLLPARVKMLVSMTRIPLVRRWMITASEKRVPGLWASMLCRKRYVDDQLRDAVHAGTAAVVILGAGLDDCERRTGWRWSEREVSRSSRPQQFAYGDCVITLFDTPARLGRTCRKCLRSGQRCSHGRRSGCDKAPILQVGQDQMAISWRRKRLAMRRFPPGRGLTCGGLGTPLLPGKLEPEVTRCGEITFRFVSASRGLLEMASFRRAVFRSRGDGPVR